MQTGFCGFNQAITGAIYFTFRNGKKLSFDCPNCTSIFKFFILRFLSRKNKEEKFILTKKKVFLSNSSLACTFSDKTCLTGPLEYKHQDNCTCFGYYLYSTKYSWIINRNYYQGGGGLT